MAQACLPNNVFQCANEYIVYLIENMYRVTHSFFYFLKHQDCMSAFNLRMKSNSATGVLTIVLRGGGWTLDVPLCYFPLGVIAV